MSSIKQNEKRKTTESPGECCWVNCWHDSVIFIVMKNFSVAYHNDTIRVEGDEQYRLTFPDDRWLDVKLQADYSRVVASSDSDTRQTAPEEWVILSTSGGPDWINREQIQVIGELISRKEEAAKEPADK